jgi:DNA-binding MarR family transcriptional regulator
MKPVEQNGATDATRQRRRSATALKAALRDFNVQMSLYNRRVGAQADLKDVELDCFDLIARHGPVSPTTLARLSGLHPATLTGILDRLEKNGWITRERDPDDRRAVLLRDTKDRNAELFSHYDGMNSLMDGLFDDYAPDELELLAEFLRKTTAAGEAATAALANEQ